MNKKTWRSGSPVSCPWGAPAHRLKHPASAFERGYVGLREHLDVCEAGNARPISRISISNRKWCCKKRVTASSAFIFPTAK